MRLPNLPFLCIALVIVLAACQTAQVEPVQRSEPVGEVDVPEEQVVVQTTEPADRQAELNALLERGAAEQFSLTYAVSGTMQDEELPPSTVRIVVGEDSSLTAATFETEQGTVEERTYFTEEGPVICVDEDGWACYFLIEEQPVLPEVTTEPNERQREVTVLDAPGRRVAGVNARCFLIRFSGEDVGEETLCLSPEGVRLYHEIRTRDGRILHEATDYTTTVEPDALTLPAEPTQFERVE